MRSVLLALMLVAPAALARAGDTAEADVIGFAEGMFAFEEFGVQDGSGFPYSNIYVVDVATDSWVEGTPIRVLLQEERATLRDARDEAEARLENRFGGAFEDAQSATLAHSPLGEVDSDPVRLAFAPVLPASPLGTPEESYVARLDLYHAETQAEDCVQFIGDRPMGFRLIVEREGGGETVLSEDDVVPRSRGCPITYRVSRVVTPQMFRPERVAVLLSVFTPGFEGPRRRFIAVTGRLPE